MSEPVGAGERFLCKVARYGSAFWDWIDKRDIDKHVTAQLIIGFFLWGSLQTLMWGYQFAIDWLSAVKAGKPISGGDLALVLAAINAPWSALAGTVISLVVTWYFTARKQ